MRKFKTIWHYGVMFFETDAQLEHEKYEVSDIVYSGEISKMSIEIATEVAPLHNKCISYYEAAMMPLFKGEGKLSAGTEDPVMAIESLKTQKESEIDMPYVLIWKII